MTQSNILIFRCTMYASDFSKKDDKYESKARNLCCVEGFYFETSQMNINNCTSEI